MPRKSKHSPADGVADPVLLSNTQPIAIVKPGRCRPEMAIEIEWIYEPDIERQMAGLCILLGLPYTRPTRKAA